MKIFTQYLITICYWYVCFYDIEWNTVDTCSQSVFGLLVLNISISFTFVLSPFLIWIWILFNSNILVSIQIMPNYRMFCKQYFSVSKTFVEQFQVLSLFFLLELQKLCRRFLELTTLTLPNVKHSLPWNSFSLRFEMQR